MADASSVSSTTTSFFNRPANNLNQARSTTGSTFASILNHTEVAIGLRPKTGFSSGATYEATTIGGQTKAAYDRVVSATKAALHIKP